MKPDTDKRTRATARRAARKFKRDTRREVWQSTAASLAPIVLAAALRRKGV